MIELIQTAIDERIVTLQKAISESSGLLKDVEFCRYVVENKCYENLPDHVLEMAEDDKKYNTLKSQIAHFKTEIEKLKEFDLDGYDEFIKMKASSTEH